MMPLGCGVPRRITTARRVANLIARIPTAAQHDPASHLREGQKMDSTMSDSPMLIAGILRHGTKVHAQQTVTTQTVNGHRVSSYGELGRRTAQLAHGLSHIGIAGDQRVGTFMWNNQEHLEAYLGVPSMGAVLHTINIRLTGDQIAHIANHAEDQVIIANAALVPMLATALPQLETVHTVILVGEGDIDALASCGMSVVWYEDLIEGQPTDFDWPVLSETSAAAMCYTSGTTGDPKGVVYSHRSTYLHSMALCTANAIGVGAGDRVLPIVPMFHANAWGLPYASLMSGAGLVMPDRFMQANHLADLIESRRVTIAAAVPTVVNDLLIHLNDRPHDVSWLRSIPCGGSAVPPALVTKFSDNHDVSVRQVWGMTETSPIAAVVPAPGASYADDQLRFRDAAGRLLCGIEARIVDDNGHELDWDATSVGELQVRGHWVTAAYYKDTDPTRFCDDWLRTGDVGSMDPRGHITLTDRTKDLIKSGGEWISSVELENHIMSHPSVVEACVVAVPDERWQERPFAVVVIDTRCQVTPSELRRYLSRLVVRWHLPERWTFVDEVPKTSVGKFDKKLIRSRYADGTYPVEFATTD